jgi:hypothetical protein
MQNADDHAELGELLIHELSSDRPLLLPPRNPPELPSLPNPEENST